MRRRRLLAIGPTVLAGGLAGCTGGLDPRTTSDPWADTDPRYPDDRSVPPDASTHHLYIENFDAEPHRVALTVVRTDDAALIWRAAYEAPDERGFEIPDVLVEGRTYDIALAIEDGERTGIELPVEPCRTAEGASATEVSGGSRNVGGWIEDGAVSFHQDRCDELRVGRLPTGGHDYFLVDE